MRKARTQPGLFAVCIDNVEYPASLESRKLYEIVSDDEAAARRQLRVVDESGEDYIYPAHYFRLVTLPPSLERILRRPRSGRPREQASGHETGDDPAGVARGTAGSR